MLFLKIFISIYYKFTNITAQANAVIMLIKSIFFRIYIESILAAKSAPTFVVQIVNQRVCEGETAKFECQFSGTPIPGIRKRVPLSFSYPLAACLLSIAPS